MVGESPAHTVRLSWFYRSFLGWVSGTHVAWLVAMRMGLLSVSLLPGCLMPPGGDELPAIVNQPPRIIPGSLDPGPQLGPKVISTRCDAGYSFVAQLTDPDEDTLFWRVFIDYYRDPRPYDSSEVQVLSPRPNDPIRPIRFSIDPKDPRFGEPPLFSVPHKVELLVSDRPFIEDLERQHAARTPQADGEVDSFVWAIELTDREDQQCPNN